MELRSSRKRNEYKELQITLNGMGFYEEGMELQEMRQILDALHQSVTEGESRLFDDDDMERAIRESEMDFMPSHNGGLWNSTMMGSQQTSSPCSSPDIPSHVIIVEAEVHHPLNWSPQCSEEERLQRKRLASMPTTAADNSDQVKFSNEIMEPGAKRIHQYEDTTSTRESFPNNGPDVNISNDCDAFLHSDSLSSSLNISNANGNNNPIQIVGPVSMRRPINDSGLISGSESNMSASSLSSTHNTWHANSISDSNVSGDISLSSSSSHVIVGRISARRPINDSGVNISNENAEHSSWEYNLDNNGNILENDSNVSDNLLSFPIRSNAFPLENDDDFEHSEPSL